MTTVCRARSRVPPLKRGLASAHYAGAMGTAGSIPSTDLAQTTVDATVVVVSWNVRDLLRRCLASVQQAANARSLQIVVVDNASTDRSADLVREEFPNATLIANRVNLGFAKANNLGLAASRGRYVFFLNPDTEVLEGALEQLIAVLERDDSVGMVGPRLLEPDGSVQPVCARVLPTLTLTLFHALYLHRVPSVGPILEKRLIAPYDLEETQDVDAISGAAMLAPRTLLEELGGFDEVFLHTAEDVDLCVRVRQRGLRIVYLAEAHVLHLGGRSREQAPVRAQAMGVISTFEYFKRSHGPFQAAVYRLSVQLIEMPLLLVVGVGKALLRRDPSVIRDRYRLATAIWSWRVDG
jgi:N-acetylglucosaminyl-diphospho-decaprenol L-rhamnosyltransferase